MRFARAITPAFRLSFSLAVATTSVLLTAGAVGLVPDHTAVVNEGRLRLAEALALQLSTAARNADEDALFELADLVVLRYPDLESLALDAVDDGVLVDTARHGELWTGGYAEAGELTIPVFSGSEEWGEAQFHFQSISGLEQFGPGVRLALFVGLACLVLFRIYLHHVLRYLDPAAVIPERVKAMLDTMTEGVLILDKRERIVLANEAFIVASGLPLDRLQGREASKLPWFAAEDDRPPDSYPWLQTAAADSAPRGVQLRLGLGATAQTFVVSATAITGEDGKRRGMLATFDDVTAIEEKNTRLQEMVNELDQVREHVESQNEELKLLATRDPLTNCLNRRALFERFDSEWSESKRYGHSLAGIMLDIDHFKAVNDEHGHAAGDAVLERIAAVLHQATRSSDIVGRYGGEEFCIALPHIGLDEAAIVAEKLRAAVAAEPLAGLAITISVGVSSIELGATSPQELIDEADRALYAAKRNGRNLVVRADAIPAEAAEEQQGTEERAVDQVKSEHVPIPYHAVLALMSALEQRHADTAEHCRRVADLCMMVGQDLMSVGDAFILEVAAMLHDIGKIGVPDAILLKPDSLTEEEWEVMETHDRIGIEIINSAFSCPELTNIVRHHHARFECPSGTTDEPSGHDIPLRARILTIADAYDAMVSDRVYRKSMPQEEAFAELRRCAGTQFDPDLVERFIETMTARGAGREVGPVDRDTEAVLRVGLAIERLVAELDTRSMKGLAAAADRLRRIAAIYDWPEIAELSSGLIHAVDAEFDLEHVIESTRDLVRLCRDAQEGVLSESHGAPLP